jgi:hypothetical protein
MSVAEAADDAGALRRHLPAHDGVPAWRLSWGAPAAPVKLQTSPTTAPRQTRETESPVRRDAYAASRRDMTSVKSCTPNRRPAT